MSYGGSSSASATGIQVTFLDQTGAKSVKAVIAHSVPVSRILPNIITKMNLPTMSPDGQPMSYGTSSDTPRVHEDVYGGVQGGVE